MSTLRRWWQRLKGREPARPPAPPRAAAAHRPIQSPGLQISDAPEPKKPGRVGAAGFDPYESDAGFAKPHTWEQVDHD